MNHTGKALLYIILTAAFAAMASCSKDLPGPGYLGKSGEKDSGTTRSVSEETRRTLILYSAGYNNLTPYFKDDIEDLCSGYLPGGSRYDDQLFIFAHHTVKSNDYRTQSTPYLIKVTRQGNEIVMDTVVTYPAGTNSVSAGTIAEVLGYIGSNYRSKEYGMIFSSHATGWLPEKYYTSGSSLMLASGERHGTSNFFQEGLRPQEERDRLPDVKSIGAEYLGSVSNRIEMDLKDFAAAIPIHLDYMIFDACLMGSIEVAYELKDVCDYLVISPAQVLADGMDYLTMTEHLLNEKPSNLLGVAQDFFEHFNSLTGSYRSATIALVDCNRLSSLAETCSGIFTRHRDEIRNIDPREVQRLDTSNWFFDFRDIIDHLQLDEDEKTELDAALADCIVYKNSTPEFIGMEISTFSGLSMYLPTAGNSYLDNYYLDFKWNKDSGFISLD